VLALLPLSLALAGHVGCGGGPSSSPGATPASPTSGATAPRVRSPQVVEGATAMQPFCAPDAAEACNAIDDNCDGRVDEDCGYAEGAVRAMAQWNSRANLDLVLMGPSGTAAVDRKGEGACAEGHRLEHAALRDAAPGAYEVRLRYVDACTDDSETTATVSVIVNGALLGVYNRTLAAGEEQALLRFEVAPAEVAARSGAHGPG
jgi:hypothetical protein